MSGLWNANTWAAKARSKETECVGDLISISPLELWVQVQVVNLFLAVTMKLLALWLI